MCNYIGIYISLAIHLATGLCIHSQYNTPMSLALESIKLLELVAIDHTGIPVMFLPVKVLWLFLLCHNNQFCEALQIAG